jgi:hypothetical protein
MINIYRFKMDMKYMILAVIAVIVLWYWHTTATPASSFVSHGVSDSSELIRA